MRDSQKNQRKSDPASVGMRKEAPTETRRRDKLTPAALRALQEAEERRQSQRAASEPAKEVGGRGGKDPARFGDWEVNGRAIDF
jgi:hypothetical protein